jgi:MoaA/NifB/PqqE/SkfB family radical SAM enzyme
MLELMPRLPLYIAFRYLGRPRLLPFSLVLSVCYRCNSRCRTCNVWRKETEELTLDEWGQIFANLGRTPFYLTFTGGEPFLRRDLVDLVSLAYEHCRPGVITIPTNGLLYNIIPKSVERILRAAPLAQVGVNLSLDGLGDQHDHLRGVPSNYEKALRTYQALRTLDYPNLTVSIHTVVSRFNVADMPAIYRGLTALEPDSYITEIAEERVELDTLGLDITPSLQEYAPVADFLIERIKERRFKGLARITQAFRVRYYDLVKRTLHERRQIIPCYAGWASGHIAPDGDVWTCCIRAEPIGNLRQTNYDLRPIWFGERAEALRRSIAAGECYCPMANASYTNMLLHLPTLLKVAWRSLF